MNYQAIRNIKMFTLNRQRATIVFCHFLEHNAILTPGRSLAPQMRPIPEDGGPVDSYGHEYKNGGKKLVRSWMGCWPRRLVRYYGI